VVTVVILSGPRHSVADPQITPRYTRRRTVPLGVARAASPTEALLARFGHYVLAERGLAAGTVRGYVSHARRFVDELSSIGALAQVTAAEVTEAVLHESTVVSVGCAAHDAAMGVAAVAWSAEDRTAARKERDD
jgi:hypothetical protein